ncbi:MAG: F-type H+-transporting ATPase subunit epsilon [Thermodesulfobacteriota bacterium]|nr:F-type H+-transporting ATPase subunit epsilon [Thermodesulfobacteriota bacterium]
MAEKFKVELVTPKGVVLDKEVEEVVAPGIMGEFGVLVGHTPMLTFIKPGVLSYLENNAFKKFAVGPGFCQVLKDSMTVLVEEAYSAEDIDLSEASAEVGDLEKELGEVDAAADPINYKRLLDKLVVARTKVALAGKS